MRVTFAAVACGLAVATLAGQSPPPTTIGFAVHASHDGATFEVETAGGVVPCGSVTVVGAERRCSATFTRTISQNIRLRAVSTLVSAWSAVVVAPAVPAGSPPGAYTITFARPVQAPQGTPMAVAVVQSKALLSATNPFSTGVATVTLNVAATVGNYLVVAFSVPASSRSVTSVTQGATGLALLTDPGSQAATQEDIGSNEQWAYGGVVGSASTAVTVTLSSALTTQGRVVVWELSGVRATTPIEDISVARDATGTSHDTGTVATANAGSLLLGYVNGSESPSNYIEDADFATATGAADTFGIAGASTVNAGTFSYTTTTVGDEGTMQMVIAIAPTGGGSTPTVYRGWLIGSVVASLIIPSVTP